MAAAAAAATAAVKSVTHNTAVTTATVVVVCIRTTSNYSGLVISYTITTMRWRRRRVEWSSNQRK